LKKRVKSWAILQKIKNTHRFSQLEESIQSLILEHTTGTRSLELESKLKTLEEERNRLLLAEEEHWHQKRRAIWIKCGDQNTKFFHHFASYRRNHKHIWELNIDSYVIISGQDNLIF
jgi:hypothetical protein